MLANIPAPWSIWAWETWGNNRKKCEIQEIPEIHGLVGKVIEVYWTSSVWWHRRVWIHRYESYVKAVEVIICVITQLVFQQYEVLYLTVVNMTTIVEWWPQGFGKSTRCSWSEGFRAGPVGWWVLGFVHQMRNYLGGSPVGGWLYRIYINIYIWDYTDILYI